MAQPLSTLTALTPASPLVLVGAGKMGGALLSGWLDAGLDPRAVIVVDPAPPPDTASLLAGNRIEPHKQAPAAAAAVLVVAVKPQSIAAVLPAVKGLVGRETLVLSIVAGKTMATFEAALGPAAIVRAMPNTPAQVGRGITAAVANHRVDDNGRALVTALLSAVGEMVWLEDEGLIDAVTAISGSGPAYVFYLVECLAQAAERLGLPPAAAARLARATIEGAGELLHRVPLSPAELRRNVTSPGGTTEAALAVLMAEDGLASLIAEAAEAASRRSRELSG